MKKIEVTVKYMGVIYNNIGKKEEKILLQDNISLKLLVQYLINKYGSTVENTFYIDKDNGKELKIYFIKNNRSVNQDETVNDGDEVVLIPPMGGG